MHPATARRTTTRRTLVPRATILVVILAASGAAVGASLGGPAASSSTSSFSAPPSAGATRSSGATRTPAATRATPRPPSASTPTIGEIARGGAPGDDLGGPIAGGDGAVTEADGLLPNDVTVFDDEYPGVARLDLDLLDALRDAARDAADDGITFVVNSGWRSPDYQDQLLREAVSEYGSLAEAARWVATVDTSPHVTGDAVDLGGDATAWLAEHGADYGLCQIYRNEPWHYELRTAAEGRRCPRMYADPTHDPRMQP